MNRLRLLWITDPWDTLDHPLDTSLRLIEESLVLGVESHWCDVKTIRWENQSVWLDSRKVLSIKAEAGEREASAFKLTPSVPTHPSTFTRLLYRTDPPVDLAYLHPLQLLILGSLDGARGLRPRPEIVNPPSVLSERSEKLEGGCLGKLFPPTIASSRWEPILAFGRKEKITVLKPLFEAQSHGIELLKWNSRDNQARSRSIIQKATDGFRRPVLLQRYLAGIKEGEQRLWFLNGRLLAYGRKIPKHGEFRIDMDHGGTMTSSTLSQKEKRAADLIGHHLRSRKIRMAAVDLIEGLVTDFNFTSPGLLVQLERITGRNLARPIIESLVHDWR